ncbi:MAG: type II toxin-antitoxin system VapC family toxin [Vicinamibacteria bacterium]
MRGLDTNVLVRYLTQDRAAQSRAVDALVADAQDKGEHLYIDDIVLCELVWVLRGAYQEEKSVIVDALERIAGIALFSFEDRDVLRRAIKDYRDGRGDFADFLIGRRNRKAGCDETVTFDKALKGVATFNVA